jgi:hypothetical protein
MKSFLVLGLMLLIIILPSLVSSDTGIQVFGGQFYQTNNSIYINPCGFIYLVGNTIYALSSNQILEIYQNTTSTFSRPFIVLYNNLVTTTIPVNETYLFVNGNVGFIIDSRELLLLCKTSLITITILPFKNFYFEGGTFLVSVNNSFIPLNGKMPQIYLWNGTLYENETIVGTYQDKLFFGIINSTTVLGNLLSNSIRIDYYSFQKLVSTISFNAPIGFLGVDIYLGGGTIYNPLLQEFYTNNSILFINMLGTYPIPLNPTLAICSNGNLITTSYNIISIFTTTTSSSFTSTPITSSSSVVSSSSVPTTIYSTITQTYTTTIIPSSQTISTPSLMRNEYITYALLIIIVVLVILLIRNKRNSK